MKRIYRMICLAAGIVLTGYLFVHVSYMHRGYTRLMGFYGMENDTIDVALVGTSVTFSSFMPMEAWQEYGMAAYNYSTNVQFENSLRHSVREIMKTQSPKLILIDIAPFIMQHSAAACAGEEDRNIKYNIDSMPYSFNRLHLIREINEEKKGDLYSFLYYNFDICRYHTNDMSIRQYNNTLHDVARGYGYLCRKEIDQNSFVYDDGAEKPLKDQHAVYLNELLAEVEQLDCEVVFFCAPVRFVQTRGDEYLRKNYVKRFIEEKGYVFWDLSPEIEKIGLDYDHDFWSDNHFDSLGAEKVTRYFSRKIVDSYDIPDRRSDERYARWHEDYREWMVIKAQYNEEDKAQ